MNNPKIAVAVFVENAGWGGDAAAKVAALVVERYLKRKTEARALKEKVIESNFMPYIAPKGVKPVQPRKVDSVAKPVPPKPMMTVRPVPKNTILAASGN